MREVDGRENGKILQCGAVSSYSYSASFRLLAVRTASVRWKCKERSNNTTTTCRSSLNI